MSFQAHPVFCLFRCFIRLPSRMKLHCVCLPSFLCSSVDEHLGFSISYYRGQSANDHGRPLTPRRSITESHDNPVSNFLFQDASHWPPWWPYGFPFPPQWLVLPTHPASSSCHLLSWSWPSCWCMRVQGHVPQACGGQRTVSIGGSHLLSHQALWKMPLPLSHPTQRTRDGILKIFISISVVEKGV